MAFTTHVSPMNVYAATDAGFRSWGKSFTDMLTTLGLSEVYSDIDWATVTMPVTATPTWAGKRVYSLNDDLSSTRNVFIAVEFGRTHTSTTTVGFGIRITVGTSHAAGSVTNYVMQHYLAMSQAPSDGGDIIGIRSDYGFAIFTNLNMGSAYQAGFAVERLCENGTPTSDGVILMMSGQAVDTVSPSTSTMFRVANYAGGQVFTDVGATGSGSSTLAFTNYQAIPVTSDPSYAGKAPAITMDTFGKYDACSHWLIVSRYLYSPSTEFDATINGVTGTYRTPATGFFADNGSTTYVRAYLALRID